MEKGPAAAVVSPLRTGSETSTFLESPAAPLPRQNSAATERSGIAAAAGTNRTRAMKRARREANGGSREGSALVGGSSRSIRSALTEPSMVMQISTMVSATGALCLVLAVFSGPVLVFLAILALGVCGMCYSVRQRGALEYLPRGVVDLLTRTTLLEFLTDTSVFDAVKTYLVFMMGLSADETQGVLRSLPRDMRETLTRPGLIHTLPRPVQGLLLPPNPSPSVGLLTAAPSTAGGEEQRGGANGRRRRRVRDERLRVGAGDGGPRETVEGARERYEDEDREAPLGQLVWNPLPPAASAPESPPRLGENAERIARRIHRGGEGPPEQACDSDDDSVGSDLENRPERDEAERREARRRAFRVAGGEVIMNGGNRPSRDVGVADGGGDGGARGGRRGRRPWEGSPLRIARSLSPIAARDGIEPGGSRSSPGRVSPAVVVPQGRQGGAGCVEEASAGECVRSGSAAAAGASAGGFVPSAERIVVSILQSRVDNAVRAAWSFVDERGVRRAAMGSGIALAAHVVISERARRQAGSMLRGGLLAALAGTATVCAGLAYLKPGQAAPDRASGIPADVARDPPSETEVAGENDDPPQAGGGRVGDEGRLSRGAEYRAGLRRWLAAVTPSTRSMVRLLGMICLLLALRKWQLLRRAAARAVMPRGMYGAPPPC